MMRSLLAAVVFLFAALGLTGEAAAAASEDVRCVQSFLVAANFKIGAADGALGKKTIEAARQFAEQFGLSDLPSLDGKTAAQWCAFALSEAGTALVELAAYRVYRIELEPGIVESGPLPFDFKPYRLGALFDGFTCRLTIGSYNSDGEYGEAGVVAAVFEGERIRLVNGVWRAKGLATPETFDKANLRVTNDGHVVGRMEAYFTIIHEGMIEQPGLVIDVPVEGGQLDPSKLVSKISFPSGEWTVELKFESCATPDAGGRDHKYKVPGAPPIVGHLFDGTACDFEMARREETRLIADGRVRIENGRFVFDEAQFLTGSISTPLVLEAANVVTLERGDITGLIDLFANFPEENEAPMLPAVGVVFGAWKDAEANTLSILVSKTLIGALKIDWRLTNCVRR